MEINIQLSLQIASNPTYGTKIKIYTHDLRLEGIASGQRLNFCTQN